MKTKGPRLHDSEITVGKAIFKVWSGEDGISGFEVPTDLELIKGARGEDAVVTVISDTGPAGEYAVRETARWITEFLAGEDPGPTPRVDLGRYPEFSRSVLAAVSSIPRGETRSYACIAARAGRPGAARAVGGAVGRNPVPILVPCHRVVRSDGSLGGFRLGSGFKKWLLETEGCTAGDEYIP